MCLYFYEGPFKRKPKNERIAASTKIKQLFEVSSSTSKQLEQEKSALQDFEDFESMFMEHISYISYLILLERVALQQVDFQGALR